MFVDFSSSMIEQYIEEYGMPYLAKSIGGYPVGLIFDNDNDDIHTEYRFASSEELRGFIAVQNGTFQVSFKRTGRIITR